MPRGYRHSNATQSLAAFDFHAGGKLLMQLPSYAQGFTLIELITVIAVLAILTLGTTHFLTDASQGYATTMSRTQLASDANISLGRMVRELKNPLPNSARTNAIVSNSYPSPVLQAT